MGFGDFDIVKKFKHKNKQRKADFCKIQISAFFYKDQREVHTY